MTGRPVRNRRVWCQAPWGVPLVPCQTLPYVRRGHRDPTKTNLLTEGGGSHRPLLPGKPEQPLLRLVQERP
eukprot:7376689-Pyramimonas_sp.AAC.1